MAAAITLTPTTGVVGQTITIDGTGFSNAEAITLTYGGDALIPVAPITTDGAGIFTGTFLVPASVQGIHSVVATDVTLLTDSENFTVNSLISLSSATGNVASTTIITGTGFAGVSLMAYTFAGALITPTEAPVTSNATGGFTATITIPTIIRGAKTVVATDAGANTDSDTYTVSSKITLNEPTGASGESVIITGTGFGNTLVISYTFAGAVIVPTGAPISSNGTGGFTATITVPTGFDDTISIVATDSGGTANVSFVVIILGIGEIIVNTTYKHLSGRDNRLRSVNSVPSRERGAVVDIPFSAGDAYVTGGITLDFSVIDNFSKVYLCNILHNPVGLVMSYITASGSNSATGKLKIWGADGNELADDSTAIASKTLRMFIRGI